MSHRGGHDGQHAGGTSNAHTAHADMVSDLRRRFWICLALTGPILLLSPAIQRRLGVEQLGFLGQEGVQLVFASVVVFYRGWPFLSGPFSALSPRQPGAAALIGVATRVA